MTTAKPNSSTVHNHFSKHSLTLPKPQVLPANCPDLLTGEVHGNERVFSRIRRTDSIIDEQSPADKAAGSSVSSF
jgi:hypothetical protein